MHRCQQLQIKHCCERECMAEGRTWPLACPGSPAIRPPTACARLGCRTASPCPRACLLAQQLHRHRSAPRACNPLAPGSRASPGSSGGSEALASMRSRRLRMCCMPPASAKLSLARCTAPAAPPSMNAEAAPTAAPPAHLALMCRVTQQCCDAAAQEQQCQLTCVGGKEKGGASASKDAVQGPMHAPRSSRALLQHCLPWVSASADRQAEGSAAAGPRTCKGRHEDCAAGCRAGCVCQRGLPIEERQQGAHHSSSCPCSQLASVQVLVVGCTQGPCWTSVGQCQVQAQHTSCGDLVAEAFQVGVACSISGRHMSSADRDSDGALQANPLMLGQVLCDSSRRDLNTSGLSVAFRRKPSLAQPLSSGLSVISAWRAESAAVPVSDLQSICH